MLWRFIFSIALFFGCLAKADAAKITAFPLDKPGQGAIILNGDIAFQDTDRFLIKIAPYSKGLVILNSRGGSAYAGIQIGKAIRLRGFTTWVPSGSLCASACATAWLGGVRRLMGKSALIGFHAVYRKTANGPVEMSSGNALYGAYLSQLGLSDKAIMYLTAAAPTSMNWLTPAQAQSLGITLSIFDPKPKSSVGSPGIDQSASLEARSRDFVIALNVLISGPTEKFLSILPGIYANQVSYFGKEISQAEVVSQIARFTARWPDRNYAVLPESLKVNCDQRIQQCDITGLINFDAKSVERNARSHGVATFDYDLAFRPNAKWPLIVSEGGKIVSRKVGALSQTPASGQLGLFGLLHPSPNGQ